MVSAKKANALSKLCRKAKDQSMEEGSATTRSLLLKSDNYSYWKNQMRSFLKQEARVEAFKMKENESINETYSKFTLIINRVKILGKVYPENEMVRKVLRYLSKRWEAKVTAIQEAKNLNVLELEELVECLMTHEITMKIYD
ncbi:hypothetical protein RJ640_001289 [Escallonia rubra]|uniref:Gag-pol polyprotein n=1 Tax=Escallonia rubra TaxID=112253 RepID=A0AA88QZZ4_9ASTE|nr:hypothetical protein RJ640_001289 [Escallonia rubra]